MRRTFPFCVPTLLLPLVIQILGSFLLWLFYLPIAGHVHAAAPITPSGLNTQISGAIVTGSGPTQTTQYDITGGTRPGGGVNLFHSFGDFNVPNHNIANFLNDSGLATSNILGRVTGGNISNIFGTIQTTGFGNANLFLMNPTGFLFGPNATVNVGGMVAFTTADYLRLAGGVLFTATPDAAADALLSAAPVAAFGFLGSNPAAIAVQGSTLKVQPGQSISLVGGNQGFTYTNPDTGTTAPVPNGVTLTDGHLLARGGQVNIASVASPGEILAGTLEKAPNINGQSFGALGTIQISEQSVIDVSGNGGGTVLIRGGQFVLDNSTISANITGPGPVTNGVESIGGGIDIQVSQNAVIQNLAVLDTNVTGNATPGVQYGGVHVKADRIEVLGTVTLEDAFSGTADPSAFTGIRSDVRPGSTGGNSGAITLEANSILMNNFAQLEAITEAAGNAGNIMVSANQNLDIDFGDVQSAAHPSIGDAGEGVSSSTGDAGNVALSSAQGNISLTNFTVVTSQTVESPGTVGNVTLRAPGGNILLADSVLSTYLQPPINQAGVPAVRAGGSGRVLIEAMNLEAKGADIGVVNLSNLPSGDITVNLSGSLSLRGGMFFTSSIHASSVGLVVNGSTLGAASSAGLNVSAHDILITDGSSLTTDTNSSGAAGPLNISADNLQLTSGGQIASKSRLGIDPQTGLLLIDDPPSGPAGTVTIQGLTGPANSVLIDGAKSGIFTDTVGTGAGGSMNILTQSLTVQNGGTLSAATSGTAPKATGGAITVNANQVQLNSGGLITAASTGPGAGGAITIGAGSTFTSNASTVSTTASQAQGGNISITTGQSVTLNNRSSISADSTGAGDAGNILINAGRNYTSTDSTVTTQATALGTEASGGNITVLATDTVQLTNNSQLNASVQGSSTTVGGNITIDPQYVILQNSQILAQANQGQGGAISINITNGGLFLSDANSTVSASSQFGTNGTVTIQSPNAPISGQIQPLGKSPLLATTLLNQHCASLAGGEFSSFTVAGRDSLPTEPGSWLASPLALGPAGFSAGTVTERGEQARVIDPAQETTVLSLRQIAPAGFLTQTFAVDWSTSCQS